MYIIYFIKKDPDKTKIGHNPKGLNHIISANNDKETNIVIDTFLWSRINQEKIKQTRKSGFSTINGWRDIGAIGKITIKIPKMRKIDFLYFIIFIKKI